MENDVLYLDCKCTTGNPLILGAPKINYEFTLKVTRLELCVLQVNMMVFLHMSFGVN